MRCGRPNSCAFHPGQSGFCGTTNYHPAVTMQSAQILWLQLHLSLASRGRSSRLEKRNQHARLGAMEILRKTQSSAGFREPKCGLALNTLLSTNRYTGFPHSPSSVV
jgi:hypothetical protein